MGRVAAMLFALIAGCAHGPRAFLRREPLLGEGRYSIESIRLRLDGSRRLVDLSEGASTLRSEGADHTVAQRGVLALEAGGSCRITIALSVDGADAGTAERPCAWSSEGDRLSLGDAQGRTTYRVAKDGDRYVLDALTEVDGAGKVLASPKGERIVIVEGRGPMASETVAVPERERPDRDYDL